MGMDIPLSAIRRQIASGIDILVHLEGCGTKPERYWKSQKLQDFRKERLRPGRCMPLKRTKNSTREKVSGKLKKKGELLSCGKAGSGGLWLRIKQTIPNTGFPGRNVCSAFSKHFCNRCFCRDVSPVMAWNAGVSGSMEGFIRTRQKNRIQKRKERLFLQFKDTIPMVTAGIQAGSLQKTRSWMWNAKSASLRTK